MGLINKLSSFYQKKVKSQHFFRVFIDTIAYFISFLFILGFIYEHGFDVSLKTSNRLDNMYEIIWLLFLAITTIRIFWETRVIEKSFRLLAWILSGSLYLTLLSVLFIEPPSGLLRDIWLFFSSRAYLMGVLFILSFLHLSYGITRLLGKKTNPSLLLASSFFIIILIGTGLLMLPHSTLNGISWYDALFMATSAVCVTGLSSVDIPSTFTLEGQLILISLVQLGGLGVMTFTSFFGLFFMGYTSLYNQLAVKDIINTNSLSGLLSTLLNILVFTLSIEFLGMLFLFIDIHNSLGLELKDEIFLAVFHGVSGFCNAGFSILPDGLRNPVLIHGHRLFYFTISFLVILGSLGFPILVNLRLFFKYQIKHLFNHIKRVDKSTIHYNRNHLFNLNTKIVLVMSGILIIGGTLFVGVVEWNHALDHFTTFDKIVHSFFNGVCLRTAGFNSIPVISMQTQTFLIVILLMIIGGGAQSTAGGIKVNSFAVIVLNLWAVIQGKDRIEVFGRELSSDSIRRSNAVILVFILVLFLSILIVSFLEDSIPLLGLTFECASALSTSGTSLEIVAILGVYGKIIFSFLMFVGRVGIITLLLGLMHKKVIIGYRYPKEDIIIN